MSGLLVYLSSFALNIIDKTGYVGVFILSFLESAAIPIPSEVVVPFSGFLAATGRFVLWEVVLVTTIANLVGAITLFWIARSGGRWILERYGRFILIHKKDLDRTDEWFARYGSAATFWSRMLPVVRTFMPLSAGVARMNFGPFALYTFLGSLPWNLGLALVGYKAGENWDFLHDYFKKFEVAIGALIVVAATLYIIRHARKHE